VHVADDCELDLPGTPQLAGRPGPYRGRQGVRGYFADAGRVWDELTRGEVVVFGRVRGRRGDEMVERRVAWFWSFREGCAVRVRANDLGPADAADSAA
jgi:ketosteroid isomerase-like protein